MFLASRLRLRSARHVPGFFRSALTVRRQVCRSPGAIGVSLLAQPLHKTFWTLSAWSDQDALDSFVRTEPHLGIMTRYHDRIADAEFAAWTASTGSLPEARASRAPHPVDR
jgi:heme-degrading monooxygenase HmoA